MGTTNANSINLLGGDDHYRGLGGNDIVVGGSGRDQISGERGTIPYGEALASISLTGMRATHLYGGTDADFWRAVRGTTLYIGDGGADFLGGGEGDDILYGRAGNDGLQGASGNDTLYGGDGNDFFDEFDGDDFYFGERGNDQIWIGAGNDTVDGGSDYDVVIVYPLSGSGGGTGERYIDYQITKNPDGSITLTDLVTSGSGESDTGTDTLINVEAIQFWDGAYIVATDTFISGEFVIYDPHAAECPLSTHCGPSNRE